MRLDFGPEAVRRTSQDVQFVIIGKLSRCHPICTGLVTRRAYVIRQINMSTASAYNKSNSSGHFEVKSNEDFRRLSDWCQWVVSRI